MNKNKTQKGITLVALIITIVVLLILAVVAISSIQKDGLLGYVENAASMYDKSQNNEAGILGSYEDYLKWQSCPGHTYVNGECSNCGYSSCGSGHTYGEWIVVAAVADCSTETNATKERVCSICENKEVQITEYYVHDIEGVLYFEDDKTCTVCGKTCSHDLYIYDYLYDTDNPGQHSEVSACHNCHLTAGYPEGMIRDCGPFEAGYCVLCGQSCQHNGDTSWSDYYDLGGDHRRDMYCSLCGYWVNDEIHMPGDLVGVCPYCKEGQS